MGDADRDMAGLTDSELVDAVRGAGLEGLEPLVAQVLERGVRLGSALAALARQVELAEGNPTTPETWAPVHALRLLGALGAPEGVQAVVDVLRSGPESDEITDAVPVVVGALGPQAVDPLLALLRDAAADPVLRGATAVAGLIEIGQRHSGERPRIRQALIALLDEPGPARDTFTSHLALTAAGVNDTELGLAIERTLLRDRIQPELLSVPLFRYLRGERGRDGDDWAGVLAGADPLSFYEPSYLEPLRESLRKLADELPRPLPQPSPDAPANAAWPFWSGAPAPPPPALRRVPPDRRERNRKKAQRRARQAPKGRGHG